MQEQAAELTHNPSALRALMDRHAIVPRRSLGQNFVADPNTVRRIAQLSGAGPGDHVLEIGAGLGSLTLALAETGALVRAVEADKALVDALRDVLADVADVAGSVEVIEGDARVMDFNRLLAGADRWLLVANLPYNLATPLVLDLLRDVEAITTMVVMVQREAAERLAAPPGSGARGVPSVLVERRGTARIVATVSRSVFRPRPRVESAVVRIDRHRAGGDPVPSAGADARFERLVRAGFGQRRKMLRRSLSSLISADAFESAGVDPAARPQQLDLRQWIALAAAQPPSSG